MNIINIQRQMFFVVLLVSVHFLCGQVGSVRFEMESGRTKCMTEDIRMKSMAIGKYQVVNPNEGHPLPDSHKVTVRVVSSHGINYHHSDHVSEGRFAYKAPEEGEYTACFSAADHKPSTTLTIEFEWNSVVATKDWTEVAKKGSVEMMETELMKMFDKIKSIRANMFDHRRRAWDMQRMNRDTNSKMFWFSFLSIGICASVTGLQLWHLKTFFEKKKLI